MARGLFDKMPVASQEAKVVVDRDGEALFFPHFFSVAEADDLFEVLRAETPWRQDKIRFFGKEHDLPRLTAWFGDEGKGYTYSGIPMQPLPWNEPLRVIRARIQEVSGVTFNSVLLNLYRTGRDSVAWHADDEPELGCNPVIGSVSLGQSRAFQLKHKDSGERKDVLLSHGSFLLMRGELQHFWVHQIPKTTRPVLERLNLTFRTIRG